MKKKNKPCPYCGEEKNIKPYCGGLICMNCGATAPVVPGYDWNTRSHEAWAEKFVKSGDATVYLLKKLYAYEKAFVKLKRGVPRESAFCSLIFDLQRLSKNSNRPRGTIFQSLKKFAKKIILLLT